MNLPMPSRILAALCLQPMSATLLARCLSTSRDVMNTYLHRLRKAGAIRSCGFEQQRSRQLSKVWRRV